MAEVDVWGRVCGPSYADDHLHTLRAQYARLRGPMLVHPKHGHLLDALAERYGVEAVLRDVSSEVELWM